MRSSETTARTIASVRVPAAFTGERLDRCAARLCEPLASRRAAYKAAKRGELLLDGDVTAPNRRVRERQRIELLAPARPPPPVYEFELRVVFEDAALAVIEKPPGIPVCGNYARTVERALPANLRPSAAADALPWPRPVHRLDAPTGGLLIVAKRARAMVALGRAFQAGRVRKSYRALASGRLPGGGVVLEPIEGRHAETRFRAVAHTRSLRTEWITTLDLEPGTGRTHQLRRHLAFLGHPIVGDRAYGRPGRILRGKGLFLWAVGVQLQHPLSGVTLALHVPEPAKFESLRRREARRWQRWHGQQ